MLNEQYAHITPYDDLMETHVYAKVNKELAIAILQSALDDADYEFLTDDYFVWKKYRLQRKKKKEIISEYQLHKEFKNMKDYREFLFTLAECSIDTRNIPQNVSEERKMFENNKINDLKKLTNYNEIVLDKISKLHGWKIGVNYQEPSIFEL